MTNSTLGGLIKDYRLQKGLSQLDIAFALGWKETSRLSRIEQGRTETPTRELLDKIIRALGLEEEEKNTLLLTGGYLPSEEEIKKIRQDTQTVLENWPYPASILDFSWRIINFNKQLSITYSQTAEIDRQILKYHPRILDILFSQSFEQNKIVKGKDLENLRKFLRTLILNFKYEQRHRTKEKWYINHVKHLMQNDLFRDLWVETNMRERLQGVVGKSATKNIVVFKGKKITLHFFLFVIPVLTDPRFELEMLVPSDQETYAYYK